MKTLPVTTLPVTTLPVTTLFRVVSSATWKQAQAQGTVPRCGNDHRADGVHLCLPQVIAYTTNTYFTADEHPMLLEVDIAPFAEQIEWRAPTDSEPWQRPLARIPGIPVDSVISITPLEVDSA